MMKTSKAKIHTFSASDQIINMLEAVAQYHQLKKSATISALIKKEFWRIFPRGTSKVQLLQGVRTEEPTKAARRNHR